VIIFEDSSSGIRSGVAAGGGMVVGVMTSLEEKMFRELGAHMVRRSSSSSSYRRRSGSS